jgi:hypothetical protein
MLGDRFIVASLVSGLALVIGAGCPQVPGDGNGGNGNGEVVEYTADLDGAQEVPPVVTNGTGSATLERTGNVLTFDVMASGLTGPLTLAHFHNAPAGQDGGVIFNLTDMIEEDNGQISIVGEWTLTNAELAQLDGGTLYINLHTAQFPDGEIRGQVDMVEAP